MTLQELKEQVQKKNFSSIYLFYGEETFLKDKYVQDFKKNAISPDFEMMNLDVFEGKDAEVNAIANAVETMPMLDERRLVIVNDSYLFATSKSTEGMKVSPQQGDDFLELLSRVPETTVLVFVESKIDKKNKFYKSLTKHGVVVEFPFIQGADLQKWVQQYLKAQQKKMSPSVIHYFMNAVDGGMIQLQQELDKLCDYTGVRNEIVENDIDLVCCKSLQAKIFDLVDGIGEKNLSKALEVYNQLLFLKEPPIRILAMVIRQFRILFQVKSLHEMGKNKNEISKMTGNHSFVVDKTMRQMKNFSSNQLEKALEDCLETDLSIKKGKMDGALAVELLIVQYSYKG